jgi:hypothetical protein
MYWPMLMDNTEYSDIRQSAIIMLLLSKPTTSRFMNLFWYLSSNQNSHLYSVFFTAVQSMLETGHPCLLNL